MTQRTRIKICGVRDVPTALAVADAGADAVGLVFVKQSPRCLTKYEAAEITAALPAFVEPVALFVDPEIETIFEITHHAGIATVQLHGQENPQLAHFLREEGLRVIKAMHFDPPTVQTSLAPWRDHMASLHGLLWDTPPNADATLTGGSGTAFDWDAFAQAKKHAGFASLPPAILAGGLTPANVADAIRTTRPYAVDVSSGVERERGVKDADKIAAFCAAVRAADAG